MLCLKAGSSQEDAEDRALEQAAQGKRIKGKTSVHSANLVSKHRPLSVIQVAPTIRRAILAQIALN